MKAKRWSEVLIPPRIRWHRIQATLFLALALLVTSAGAFLELHPLEIAQGIPHSADVAGRALPPNFSILWTRPKLLASLGETVSVAFLATLGGGTIALLLSTFAAANTTPHPLARALVRGILAFERSMPVFVILLIVQVAVGFGPFSAMLAILVGSIGLFGKLFADAIEAVDPRPIEALSAIGASRWQRIRYGIVPGAMPTIVSHWLYAFDINFRSAIALGVVGGGGLGFEFYLSQKLLRHDDMLALTILIGVLIFMTERVSDAIRRRLLQSAGP